MTEEELLERWQSERAIYEAWGKHVAARVVDGVRPKVSPIAAEVFLRLPQKPRLKAEASFLEKAFYRNKPYTDPYADTPIAETRVLTPLALFAYAGLFVSASANDLRRGPEPGLFLTHLHRSKTPSAQMMRTGPLDMHR
jgi:hypothetical protein